MFKFLEKLLNPRPQEAAKPAPKPEEKPKPEQQEQPKPEPEEKPAEKSSGRSGTTYEEWRAGFPKLLPLIADALEKCIPGDRITEPQGHVFVSAEVYGKCINVVYIDIAQSSDGKMTLKLDSGRRDSDLLVGEYFFEAGRTKEEILNFLRSPEMPDIFDKTILRLDEKYRNR